MLTSSAKTINSLKVPKERQSFEFYFCLTKIYQTEDKCYYFSRFFIDVVELCFHFMSLFLSFLNTYFMQRFEEVVIKKLGSVI